MTFVKTAEGAAYMRVAGRILAETLDRVAQAALPGVRQDDLDTVARTSIEAAGAAPAFLGYRPEGAERPFPATLCVSVNDVVVHGVPTEARFQVGDVVKLDLGVRYRGWYADAARTVGIGSITGESKKLIAATEEALRVAVAMVRPGKTLGDIGSAIEAVAKRSGVTVIRGLTGHGIGRALHEEPTVLNYGRPGAGMKLVAGMALAIEPMFAAGEGTIYQRDDEGYATVDGSMTAQFEHTVLVTEHDAEVLTMHRNP